MIATVPEKTQSVFEDLKKLPGLVECHNVMGPYDIIVKLAVATMSNVIPLLTDEIRMVPGVDRTTTLVTLPKGS